MTLPKVKAKDSYRNVPANKSPDKNVVCNLCDVRFTQKKALYVHLRNKHHIEPLEKKQGTVECPQCKNMFYDKYNLRRHCRRVHGASPVREEKKLFLRGRVIDTDRKPTFILNIEKNYLQTHKESVVENNSYSEGVPEKTNSDTIICDMCNDAFTSKNNLIRHIGEVHTKNQNLRCVECKETFQDRVALLQHTHPLGNYNNLEAILPEVQNYKYEVAQQVKINDTSFIADIYCNLSSRDDANKWLDEFQRKNKVTFRKMRRQCQSFDRSYVFIIDRYRCQHNTLPKRRSTPHAKHTGCSATLFIRVYQHKNVPQLSWSRIRIKHTHNHLTDAAAKFRDPVEEVVNKFRIMFDAGKGPKAALNEHIKDLQLSYGDDMIADRGICPSSRWVYNFYRKMTRERSETNCEKRKLEKPLETNTSMSTINMQCFPNEKFPQPDSSSFDNLYKSTLSTPCRKPEQSKPTDLLTSTKNVYDGNPGLVVSSMNLVTSDKFQLCQTDGYVNSTNTNLYSGNDYQLTSAIFSQNTNLVDINHTRTSSYLGNDKFQKSPNQLETAKLILNEFDHVISQIRSRVSIDPLYFSNAVKNFIHSYNSTLSTPGALNTALYAFGKYSDFEIDSL